MDEACHSTVTAAGKPKISEEERRLRREAVNYGNASVGLEGLKPTPESLALDELYVSGEIDMDELIARGIALANSYTK